MSLLKVTPINSPTATSSSSVLSADALSWKPVSAKRSILSDVTLSIPKGAVTAIVGPNGAGKTSLLKCLLGLNTDYEGVVKIQGKDLQSHSRHERAKTLAYVSQQTDVMADLTVFELVQMGLLPHHKWYEFAGESRHKSAMDALKIVGMDDACKHKMTTLSGGELQRVLIARALVQKPQIMVLDEPTNHLDVYYQHQILHLLSTLDISVLLTVHDLNLAAQYCDYIVLMHEGCLRGQGTPKEVFNADMLTHVFGLPCSVSVSDNKEQKSILNICFHPTFDSNNAFQALNQKGHV